MRSEIVHVGQVAVGGGSPLVLIAGPCVMESKALAINVAEALAGIARRLDIPLIFKSSYDKANRSGVNAFRGPGIDEGLKILSEVRCEFGIPIISDVHSCDEASVAGEVLDCLQIPAFLCRQTDLLVSAGATGKPVSIKKGQFMAPEDMSFAAEKVRFGGGGGVLLAERGTSFGYHRLIVDFEGLSRMAALGFPIVFDATHSVQRPGSRFGSSGGDRAFAAPLARAAVAVGIDALFLEVHPNPDEALCDGPNSLALDALESFLSSVLALDRVRREFE